MCHEDDDMTSRIWSNDVDCTLCYLIIMYERKDDKRRFSHETYFFSHYFENQHFWSNRWTLLHHLLDQDLWGVVQMLLFSFSNDNKEAWKDNQTCVFRHLTSSLRFMHKNRKNDYDHDHDDAHVLEDDNREEEGTFAHRSIIIVIGKMIIIIRITVIQDKCKDDNLLSSSLSFFLFAKWWWWLQNHPISLSSFLTTNSSLNSRECMNHYWEKIEFTTTMSLIGNAWMFVR